MKYLVIDKVCNKHIVEAELMQVGSDDVRFMHGGNVCAAVFYQPIFAAEETAITKE